ncbi:FACT complex subunit ssrp1 [Gurleya vavrai]
MDVISIDDLFFTTPTTNDEITLKLAHAGIAMKVKQSGQIISIKKEDLKDIELFRGIQKFNMRIITNDILNVNNLSEHKIDEIKHFCSKFYNIAIYQKELEINEPQKGKLLISGDFLEFKNNNLVFDIPLKEIENVYSIKNELTFSFKEQKNSVVELKFVTDNLKICDEIKERTEITKANEILAIESIQSLVPRGKNDYIFYDTFFKMVGSTYEHKIFYSSIKQIFWLEKENNEHFLAFEADPPIRQGQTRYSFVVMVFKDDIEEEISLNLTSEDKRRFPSLLQEYSGSLGFSFMQILKSMTNAKVHKVGSFSTLSGIKNVKCTLKASDGHLFPLDSYLIFMPKAILMPLKEIQNIEFSRVNVSKFAAKTFDMKIEMEDKTFMFASLPKEDFGQLEQYFSEKNIKITSEVINEVHSYSSEDEEEEIEDEYSDSE